LIEEPKTTITGHQAATFSKFNWEKALTFYLMIFLSHHVLTNSIKDK
jgi:hypothetical protein